MVIFLLVISLYPVRVLGYEKPIFMSQIPIEEKKSAFRLRSNILPWFITIPNVGAEITIQKKWSVMLDVMYCPWKLSDKFSVKTLALLPEARWWLKTNTKGSFFNIHLDVAWYNVRTNNYRYQDKGRPLIGGGIGYGYRLPLKGKWAMEFEIGVGMANTRYERYYNIINGALKDTRVSTYWGIDRLAVSISYDLKDL